MEEKTFVDDINRSVYDIKNEENDSYRIKQGLTPEIVEKISEEKHAVSYTHLTLPTIA